jgi:hypothetical protein
VQVSDPDAEPEPHSQLQSRVAPGTHVDASDSHAAYSPHMQVSGSHVRVTVPPPHRDVHGLVLISPGAHSSEHAE